MKRYVTLILLLASFATAYTIHVPSDYSLIHYAIGAAQDGDTVLVAPGSYVGGFSFQGKNIVVRSSAGAGSTFLKSPFDDYHCVMMVDGEDSTAVLEGFSITNIEFEDGPSDGRDPPDHGGGLYIIDSSPTITDCIITNCASFGNGAGVYIENSSALIENCTITDNIAYSDGSGGGICATGTPIGSSPCRIIDCVISENISGTSGGLSITHQNIEIINNSIIENIGGTGSGAGGIGVNSPDALIYSNYIYRNDGATGGGIGISGGSPTIIGNMIVENEAGYGGGIYEASGGNLTMRNNTVAYNSASQGGGIRSGADSVSFINMIVWGNTANIGSQISLPASMTESHTYIEYSCIQYGQDSIYIGSLATLDWGPGNIDADPLFESGPICDYHLSMSSPCVDAGNPSVEYNDPEDPFNPGYALWPAMGYLRNDMGAFGGGGVGYWLSAEEEQEEEPLFQGTFSLGSFPNPFTSSCTVCFKLDEPSYVDLSVYDLSGRLVEVVSDEYVAAGMHSRHLDGSGLASGVYLIRISAGGVSETRRCVVVR